MRRPEKFRTLYTGTLMCMMVLSLILVPGYAGADSDTEALRKQLEEQRTLIRAQQQQLEKQSQALDELGRRLDEMAVGKTGAAQMAVSPQPAPADATKRSTTPGRYSDRDSVGDLNADAVRAGEFPGSFTIPGPGKISLAIGGFIKTAVIYDSDAEAMGADFLPATLGTSRPDTDGAVSLDATLTRLHLDGRAPIPSGQVRGYVEYDLNAGNNGSPDFKIRHAYGTWKNDYGTLTAGHTWSTFMDLKILPEGLTEPTVSGVIFMRQAILRWSQPLSPALTLHAAIEDPNSSDVFSDETTLGHTSVPDGVLGLDYDPDGSWHLRLNGLARNIKVDMPAGGNESETGWGLALSGHLDVYDRDKLRFSSLYGEGLGRYLLGIQSTAGSVINSAKNSLELHKNWGGMVAYEHHWTDILRSTAMGGYAKSKSLGWQADDTFESSTYASVNLMWSVYRYITLGVEYAYGRSENKDNSDLDNHRLAFGVQVY